MLRRVEIGALVEEVGLIAQREVGVREAGRYGLYDLDRLERMILRRVTREYFLLEEGPNDD